MQKAFINPSEAEKRENIVKVMRSSGGTMGAKAGGVFRLRSEEA